MNVGDKVWYVLPRNSEPIYEGVISKIGRKYFYVSRRENDRDPYKVDLKTMRGETDTGWGYRCRVYLSKQEILDIREKGRLLAFIEAFFRNHLNSRSLSLETLREIAKHLHKE